MSKRVSFDVSKKIVGTLQFITLYSKKIHQSYIDTWIHSNSNLYVSVISKEQRRIFTNEFDTE